LWSDSIKEMNLIYGKLLKYTQLFFLWATHFRKRTLNTSKIIGIKRFKLLSKDNNGHLHKIGLKMKEWRFKELSSSSGGAMSLTPIDPSPLPGKCTSGAYFLPYLLSSNSRRTLSKKVKLWKENPRLCILTIIIILSIQLFVIIYSAKHLAGNFFLSARWRSVITNSVKKMTC